MTGTRESSTSQALVVGLYRWLRVRWWLAPGQIVAITAAGPIPPRVPLWLLATLSLLAPIPGLFAGFWRRRESARALLGVLILGDLILLTIALALCGGPANPFSILYLVYVTLACVLLGPSYGWLGTGVASIFYAMLFFIAPGAEHHGGHMHGQASTLWQHLWSMYFAFVAVAVLVVAFVASVMRTLRVSEKDLVEARERAERSERLANVMVLAAGTAHEMGTPLSTIAVTAKEMERTALAAHHEAWVEDARLIRDEVERCRRLLADLRGQAGAMEGEAPSPVRLEDAVAAVADELPDPARRRLVMEDDSRDITLRLPRAAFALVLGNLVRNALEASPPESDIVVGATRGLARITVSVKDRGHGMDEATAARAREPFFTTKPVGTGLGLGLFLADRFARDMGGVLALDSRPGHGTEARLELPA
jgi:two-component system sensor histidine kinase RegB